MPSRYCQTIEAFEIGNELDLHCNNADSPTSAEWAKHHWQWFLSPMQVQTFVNGYGPFLTTAAAAIRSAFPQAQIITYGNSLPAATPLIAALAQARDIRGKSIDYTQWVDGYGTHLYPVADTTFDMIADATGMLRNAAAYFPHLDKKTIWITEWNPSSSSWWNGKPWYFQYDAQGQSAGDLNKADARGRTPAMNRAGAIQAFNRDVVATLRTAQKPMNISHVFFYAYDSAGPSPKCSGVKYS
ncbi:MAG TPA: hypothetical protein VGU72_14710 [Beijerinckiaceae bacterium]|nr:hypothetical protein [Beijerinckiaceae bacterium]